MFMGLLLFFVILFFVLAGGGWLIGKSIGNVLFPTTKEEKATFIDKSVHHHYHDNRTVNLNGEEFKSLKK